MRVVVAGGTGFLGRSLVAQLGAAGDEVIILTRSVQPDRPSVRHVAWNPDGSAGPWSTEIDGADAVVNLAGEDIAGRRWTENRKTVLRQSRILSTRSLVAAVRRAAHKPPVFLNTSAVGYYGDTGDEPVDESFPPGSDFLATLCVDWEAEAHAVAALGCRLIIVRSGLVLATRGGVLERLKRPFQLFAGGPLGSGRQFVSWIHLDDWTALAVRALQESQVSGTLNATAPNPVTNLEFSRAIGRALQRPSWLPVPRLALRVLLGEIVDVALFSGQRVLPKRPLDQGFTFRYSDIDAAMAATLGARSRYWAASGSTPGSD